MIRRIGKLTIATHRLNVGAYWNHTPYRTTFAGVNVVGRWYLNMSRSAQLQSVAVGPFVVGRCDVLAVPR